VRTKKPDRRKPRNVKASTRNAVLLEAGYVCANPICRLPLIEVHHIEYVENGGSDAKENLIPLCPLCHARVHQGSIPDEAIRTWKVMLVATYHAWTKDAANGLLFLDSELGAELLLTGDGVVRFAELLVSGLARAERVDWVGDSSGVFPVTRIAMTAWPASEAAKQAYRVTLTDKGKLLVGAWKSGEIEKLRLALGM